MSRRPRSLDKPQESRLGSVRIGETVPLSEASRRMGWGREMSASVQKMGLRTVQIGKRKYTTGDEIHRFVSAMMGSGAEGGPDA